MKQKNFLVAFLCFFISTSLFSVDRYVGTTITDGGATLGSQANPHPTVSGAVSAASDNDKIIILGTVTQTGEITLDKNLTFEGQSEATITGNGSNRLFVISASDISISFSDIIFQGIASIDPDPGNSAPTDYAGGVLFNTQANFNLTITNCVFSGNSSTSTSGGGALYLSGGGTTTANISNSTFYNNQIVTATTLEARGGAIIVYNATVNLTNCTFFENKLARTGNFNGAAVRASASGATVNATNCLFYNNQVSGGANSDFNAVPGASMTMTNCLAQYQNNLDTNNNSTITNSDYLSASNLVWNSSMNRVIFSAPNSLSDATPIDFGNDNNDAGAWDSEINIFEGTTSILWSEDSNWSSGTAPVGDGTENIAIIGSICNMFSTGIAVNDIKVTTELRIQNQNVFIVNGESDITGTVRYFANLQNDADNTKAWYLVASPLSGEVFDTAFADKNDLASGTGSNRGLATYNPSNSDWSYFTGTNIPANSGKGFSMKITPDNITFEASGGEYANNEVGFEGDFNTEDVTITTNTTGFNLLGNPYVAHINTATFLGDASGIDKSQIWVWNQTLNGGAGQYEAQVSGDNFMLAPAQGFFVKVTTPGNLNFAESNQATTGGTFQKTARTELKLLVSDGKNSRFTKIYFLDNATKGYDFGWEGEVFDGVKNDFELFTHLVKDNQGKNYQIQSLPKSELESLTIPLGIIAEAEKELTFSLKSFNFPLGVKVYLEDRSNNTFNEISKTENFKISLLEATNDVGRFYLHTSSSALSTESVNLNSISIYSTNNSTLRIVGLSQGKSNVKMFNVLGKQVLNTAFTSNGVYDLNLPKLATGIYIVQLENNNGTLNKKIVLE
ncbi:T9SS type A sorting domain-containing protein [Polaribacter sp.]|uniref:T9SS type A sorting domain-containing protein n=1 Tax=Polaribacter sp. TaxID=1920175 RepID=UPI003F6B7F2A